MFISGNKRKRDSDDYGSSSVDDTKSSCDSQTNLAVNGRNSTAATKRQAQEGFSWWTCLQLDLSLSKSKPQPSTNTDQI